MIKTNVQQYLWEKIKQNMNNSDVSAAIMGGFISAALRSALCK